MMRGRQLTAATASLAAVVGLLYLPSASAQLGMYTLPKDDFIWNWGRTAEDVRSAFRPDIEMRGGEAGFQCELTASLRASSPVTADEVEEELRARLDFIYAVSQVMNDLDFQFALEWATLDCDRLERAPLSEAERAERESKARDKMQREIERRRARQRADSE